MNDKPEILNSRIWSALDLSEDEHVEWRSPLKSDGYAEYRDQAFLDLLNVKLEKMSLTKSVRRPRKRLTENQRVIETIANRLFFKVELCANPFRRGFFCDLQ
jgi:hypothetical protein